jgi:hypothetical protein
VADVSDSPDFASEIAYLQQTPVEQILGNHIIVLVQLVSIYLGATPPNLPSAQLVIDTLEAQLRAAGNRLGEHTDLYRAALAEAQQAYVRAVASPSA